MTPIVAELPICKSNTIHQISTQHPKHSSIHFFRYQEYLGDLFEDLQTVRHV